MELCETPVEWDLEMSEAAEAVAVCSTGRLMTGREGTKGRVDDLGKVAFSAQGRVPALATGSTVSSI